MSNHYKGPSIGASYQVSVHWAKRFQRRKFLEIDHSETQIACGGHVFNESGRKEHPLQKTFHRSFLPNVGSFWESDFRGEYFQKSTNQKQELPVTAMFLNGSGRIIQRTFHRCILGSFGSCGQAISEEMIYQKSTKQKEELPVTTMFVNGSGRNEKALQRTLHRCIVPSFGSLGKALSANRDEMSILYRGHSIDDSYQMLVHFGIAISEEKIFLEIDQSETRIACDGHVC